MDISKASNFERFIFDVVGRDPVALRSLWETLRRDGAFDLAGTLHWQRVQTAGFTSGKSTHADRLATIREALGREPQRPAAYADLESRPQHCTVLPADVAQVQSFIAERAAA